MNDGVTVWDPSTFTHIPPTIIVEEMLHNYYATPPPHASTKHAIE